MQAVAVIEANHIVLRNRQPGAQAMVAIVGMRHEQVEGVGPAAQEDVDQGVPFLDGRVRSRQTRRGWWRWWGLRGPG